MRHDDRTDDLQLDTEALAAWMGDRTTITPPLEASQISGGRSNLTYRVVDAEGRAFIVRRPPLGNLLPGAHDMSREHRVMHALADTPVPVPQMIGHCDDPDVIGAEFYAMSFVDGLILRTAEDAEAVEVGVRATATRSLAATMAAMHAVDPAEVGLGSHLKGQDYLARQLHVWRRQLDAQKGRELPDEEALHARLAANIPEQRAVSIVHGDYRLDNVVLHPDGTVAAVLDWELWTLGDPLADLAITMTYWADGDDPALAVIGRPTTAEGFGDRHAFRAAYEEAGGLAMPDDLVGYYLAFGVWRQAAILEGVYQRNLAGAYGEGAEGWRVFEDLVPTMLDRAAAFADEAGI
ncbi:phosphotransferase family protein [Euzebya sp.]|uniref:phosphotransferase family protein n=1 Tax=Euzebya sp. TaxID=1971409 RepID=UPI003514580E